MKVFSFVFSLLAFVPTTVQATSVCAATDTMPPCDSACDAPATIPEYQAGRCVMLGEFDKDGCTWELSSVVDIFCVATGVGFVVRPQAAKGRPTVIADAGGCNKEVGFVGGIQLATGPFGRNDGTMIHSITEALSGVTNYVGRKTSGPTFTMKLYDPGQIPGAGTFMGLKLDAFTSNFARRQVSVKNFSAKKSAWTSGGRKCNYRSATLISGCYFIVNSPGTSHQAAVCDSTAVESIQADVEDLTINTQGKYNIAQYEYLNRLHSDCPIPTAIDCSSALGEISADLAGGYKYGRSSAAWSSTAVCTMTFDEELYDKRGNTVTSVSGADFLLDIPLRMA